MEGLKEGDRVAIEPGVCCRKCSFCKEGRYNLCLEMKFCATPPIDGNLCRYYTHAADFCYKLPENVSLEEGALMEPLAVGVHACSRAGVTLGSKVLICGAGPIGLVNLLTAKAMGASEVVITDIDEHRLKVMFRDFPISDIFCINLVSELQVAREMGATGTYLVQKGVTIDQMIEAINGQFDGDMANVSIECSGVESSIRLAIFATKSGGVVVLVGLGAPEITMPIVNACVREVDIRGIFRYANCYPKAISMVASGAVNVKPLITHRFQLEESVEAFKTAKTGAGGAIKVMIKCKKEE